MPFVLGVTKAGQDTGLKAGDLVKTIAEPLGGRGGGKPDMAQGAGTNPDGIDAAISQLRSVLQR